jgi:putative ABC transport system ATP-binding protein
MWVIGREFSQRRARCDIARSCHPSDGAGAVSWSAAIRASVMRELISSLAKMLRRWLETVAIVGPSGSGKSTVMNMITGIDRPTCGAVTVDGQRIDQMSEEQLAVWRGRRVGVVFQFFQLLPTLTAIENAMLPLDFSRRVPKHVRAALALHNLDLVGLAE